MRVHVVSDVHGATAALAAAAVGADALICLGDLVLLQVLLIVGLPWVAYAAKVGGAHVWLPDEDDDARTGAGEAARDYDVDHYLRVLVSSYASRLRKAFAPEDFERQQSNRKVSAAHAD